jgi:hypothetical protein
MNTVSEQASVAEEIAELIRRGRNEHKDYLLREAHALMEGPDYAALPEWRQRKLSDDFTDAVLHNAGGLA